MSNLFVFGCSYSENYHFNYDGYVKYYDFLGKHFPKTWSQILSEKLNYNLLNYAEGGSGNNQIFNKFCKKCDEIKKNDIVILQWSFIERYRIVDKYGNGWLQKGAGKQFGDNEPLTDDCHESIVLNRTHKQYYDEIYDFEKIIDRLSKEVGFDVYYWTIINELIYNLPKDKLNNKKYLLNDKIKDKFDNTFSIILKNGGKTISDESEGKINDTHMGKKSHQIQADLFHEHIIKNR